MTPLEAIKDKIREVLQRQDLDFKQTIEHIHDLVEDGHVLECPACECCSVVYHLEWSAITCGCCDNMVNKEDWKVRL